MLTDVLPQNLPDHQDASVLNMSCQDREPFVSQHVFTAITKMMLQKFIFISLSYRDHLAVQVFQEQMVYQDHQGQCLCCL